MNRMQRAWGSGLAGTAIVLSLVVSGCCRQRCGGLLGQIAARRGEHRVAVNRPHCDSRHGADATAPPHVEAPNTNPLRSDSPSEAPPAPPAAPPIPDGAASVVEPHVEGRPLPVVATARDIPRAVPAVLKAPNIPWHSTGSQEPSVPTTDLAAAANRNHRALPRAAAADSQWLAAQVGAAPNSALATQAPVEHVEWTGPRERLEPTRVALSEEVTLRAVAVIPYRNAAAQPIRSWELIPLQNPGRPFAAQPLPIASRPSAVPPATWVGSGRSDRSESSPATEWNSQSTLREAHLRATAVPHATAQSPSSVHVAELPASPAPSATTGNSSGPPVTFSPLPRLTPDRDAVTRDAPQ